MNLRLPALLLCLFPAFAHAKTLQDDLKSEIDSRLAVSAATPLSVALFSSADDAKGVYVRNPGVWTHGIDLSGIAAYSGAGTGGHAGTLITPADIVVANHFKLNIGEQCTFVDNRNVTYYATVIALINVTGDLTLEHVTWIKKVPSTLRIMPILSPDYERYAPGHQLGEFPVLCTNQFRQVFVQESADPDPFRQGLFLHFPAKTPSRVPFTHSIIVGDSSQPVMAVIHGVAVLIACNTTTMSGVSCPDHFADINRALKAMGSRWQATAMSLKGFPTY